MFHVKQLEQRQPTFPVSPSAKTSWRGRARRALAAIPPGTGVTLGEIQTLIAAAGIEPPPPGTRNGGGKPWAELVRDGMARRILRRMGEYRNGERVYLRMSARTFQYLARRR